MNTRKTNHRWTLANTGAALLLTCLSATAQERPADMGEGLQLVLGAGVINGPKYPGSSVTETRPLPLISAHYGRYFVGSEPGSGVPVGLGVNLIEDSRWRFGAVVGPDLRSPRKESYDSRLRGLGDVDTTVHAGAFGSYSQDWWSVRGNVLSDVGGKHEGTTASLELEGRYQLTDRVVLSAGPGLTWADKHYTRTFFGIDGTQAANSGLARFDAGAGLNSLRFSLGAEYRIDSHWFVSARASVQSLRGDAKDSPITAKATPHTIGIFAGYRF